MGKGKRRFCAAGCAYEQISHKVLTHGYLEKHTTLSAPIKRKKKNQSASAIITWPIKADDKTHKLLNPQASSSNGYTSPRALVCSQGKC